MVADCDRAGLKRRPTPAGGRLFAALQGFLRVVHVAPGAAPGPTPEFETSLGQAAGAQDRDSGSPYAIRRLG